MGRNFSGRASTVFAASSALHDAEMRTRHRRQWLIGSRRGEFRAAVDAFDFRWGIACVAETLIAAFHRCATGNGAVARGWIFNDHDDQPQRLQDWTEGMHPDT